MTACTAAKSNSHPNSQEPSGTANQICSCAPAGGERSGDSRDQGSRAEFGNAAIFSDRCKQPRAEFRQRGQLFATRTEFCEHDAPQVDKALTRQNGVDVEQLIRITILWDEADHDLPL